MRISLRPDVGSVAVYRIRVRAVTLTAIGDAKPRRRLVSSTLVARHQVLASDKNGSRVEVRLTPAGGSSTTFVIRLDGAAQLTDIQQTQGAISNTLDDPSLSEIFPATAAAPPDGPLEPGDRWPVDQPVRLDGPRSAHLRGEGRLVALGVADGRHLAHVTSAYRFPVHRAVDHTGGRVVLDGALSARTRVAYDLGDGEVASATTRSSGTYKLKLLAPGAAGGSPVPGTLNVEVSSTSHRIN